MRSTLRRQHGSKRKGGETPERNLESLLFYSFLVALGRNVMTGLLQNLQGLLHVLLFDQ
jgi:hypothetical protein